MATDPFHLLNDRGQLKAGELHRLAGEFGRRQQYLPGGAFLQSPAGEVLTPPPTPPADTAIAFTTSTITAGVGTTPGSGMAQLFGLVNGKLIQSAGGPVAVYSTLGGSVAQGSWVVLSLDPVSGQWFVEGGPTPQPPTFVGCTLTLSGDVVNVTSAPNLAWGSPPPYTSLGIGYNQGFSNLVFPVVGVTVPVTGFYSIQGCATVTQNYSDADVEPGPSAAVVTLTLPGVNASRVLTFQSLIYQAYTHPNLTPQLNTTVSFSTVQFMYSTAATGVIVAAGIQPLSEVVNVTSRFSVYAANANYLSVTLLSPTAAVPLLDDGKWA